MEPVQAYQDRAVVIMSDGEGLPVSAFIQDHAWAGESGAS
jgi:hypothetical protein